jgi:hypothetical protein
VDCLGLTKRWSLYVASHGNSRVWAEAPGSTPSRDRRDASIPYSPASVRAVASSAYSIRVRKPRLEQPALSLSHLTWS